MKHWHRVFTWPILSLIILAASWSLFQPAMFRVHDYVHAARIAEMTQALLDGHFPVRWSQHFGYGYGMPLFEFYAPLPFYIGSFLYWLGFHIVIAVKALFLIPTIVTVAGAFQLGKRMAGRSGGLLLAAALTLAPYRAVNLFVRGAVSEAWGMMWLPWILLFLFDLIERRSKWSSVGLSLSLAGLMLSHNLTTLMFVPFSVFAGAVYLLWIVVKQRRKLTWFLDRTLAAALSYVLAVGLATFYMLPAISENAFTKIDSILSGYFHYSQHFLYIRQLITPFWGYGGSQWGPEDGISFFLGFGQLVMLALASIFFLRKAAITLKTPNSTQKLRKLLSSKNTILLLIFGIGLVLSTYLTLLKSKPIWDSISVLAYIQFPWRWLALTTVCLSILGTSLVNFIQWPVARYWVTAMVLALLFINATYFRPEKYLNDYQEFYYTDTQRIVTDMSGILPDYIPEQMEEPISPPPARAWIATNELDSEQQPTVLIDKTHQILVVLDQMNETELFFSVADFPGWQVYLDGKPIGHQVGSNGAISILVPPGGHQIGLNFEYTRVRQTADSISAVSFVLLLGWIVFVSKKTDKKKAVV